MRVPWGGTMGAGVGMGMGFGMGNVMGNMTGNMNTGNQNKADSSGNASPPPPPSKNVQYFVLLENKQNGPHNLNAIQDMINSNMINRKTLVWKEGMSDWRNIMDQNDLKEMFDKKPPPPPTNS